MPAHARIYKAVLPIAPCPEDHASLRIGIDHRMCPVRGNHHLIPFPSCDCHALAGIVVSALLRVDDRLAFQYFEYLRGRPSAVRCDCVNMALTAWRLFSQTTGCITDKSKQQHPLAEN